MTAPSTRYREIDVAGTPREMGYQIGEAAREEIRGFCEVALQRVNRTVRVSRARAMRIVAASIPYARSYAPDLMDELEGTAAAAGVTLDDLMLLQVRNQLTADPQEGCTSISLATPLTANGGAIVAQNWDNDPLLDDFTVALTRRPAGKPSLLTITQAGLIAYIGLNSAGLGACLNTLPAPSRDAGVPHYFTLRRIYEAHSLAAAVEAVREAERAIPANIMLATPQGPADLEVTLDAVHVLQPSRSPRLTHTNHCLHPELVEINCSFPELIQSQPRKQRIDALVNGIDGEITVADVERMLRDHEHHPRSICRHANDDAVTGFWQTVFSVVIEPQQGCMHVTRGTPCDRPYETYWLT